MSSDSTVTQKKHSFAPMDGVQCAQILFYCAFAIYLVVTTLGYVKVSTILIWSKSLLRHYLYGAAICLLLVKFFFFQKTDPVRRLIALCMIILGAVTWIKSASAFFFWMTIFLAAGKDIRIRKLAKISLTVLTAGFMITVLCAQAGLIESVVSVRANGMNRTSLGFVHPNTCGLYVFEICLSACAVRFGRRPTWEILLAAAGAVFCWMVPNSRTFALSIGVLIVLVLLFYYVKSERMQRILTALMAVGTLFLVGFSYFCMLFYTGENSLLASLDSALSGRLSYAHQFYTQYGLNLLGEDYAEAPIIHDNVRFLVDNSYCHVLLRYGLAAAAVLLIILAVFYTDAILHRRWTLCLLGMTMMVIIGFSEAKFHHFCSNYFLIAASGIFYGTPAEGPPEKQH